MLIHVDFDKNASVLSCKDNKVSLGPPFHVPDRSKFTTIASFKLSYGGQVAKIIELQLNYEDGTFRTQQLSQLEELPIDEVYKSDTDTEK